jgi:hypothetical protein
MPETRYENIIPNYQTPNNLKLSGGIFIIAKSPETLETFVVGIAHPTSELLARLRLRQSAVESGQ